jgi:hypothetical protein
MTIAVLSVNPLFRMRRAAAQMPLLAGLYRAVDAGGAGGTGEPLLGAHLHHQETLFLLQVLPARECGQLSAHPRQLHRADPSQGAYWEATLWIRIRENIFYLLSGPGSGSQSS